jgi:hypothetical protein
MLLVIFFLVYLTLACTELEEKNILFIKLGEKLVNIDSPKKVEINANELIQVDDYTFETNDIFLHISLENTLIQHSTSLEI